MIAADELHGTVRDIIVRILRTDEFVVIDLQPILFPAPRRSCKRAERAAGVVRWVTAISIFSKHTSYLFSVLKNLFEAGEKLPVQNPARKLAASSRLSCSRSIVATPSLCALIFYTTTVDDRNFFRVLRQTLGRLLRVTRCFLESIDNCS